MKLWIAVAMSVGACAQLENPRLGTMLDSNAAARPLYGVPGSVTVGDATATGVLSIACSRTMCLAKTDTSILSSSQATDAPPGPALLALDGDAAFVYFAESGQLARWHDGQLDYLDFAPGGDVLALRVSSGAVEFAVRRDGRVWIMHGSDVIDSLPYHAGPVALLKSGALYATGGVDPRSAADPLVGSSAPELADGGVGRGPGGPPHLVLHRRDGSEIRFDVDNVDALFSIGDNYIQVRSDSSNYAVRIDSGREQLFLLPEAPP